jgi:hypothetical protein
MMRNLKEKLNNMEDTLDRIAMWVVPVAGIVVALMYYFNK